MKCFLIRNLIVLLLHIPWFNSQATTNLNNIDDTNLISTQIEFLNKTEDLQYFIMQHDEELKKIIQYHNCNAPNRKCQTMPFKCMDCNLNKNSANCSYGESITTNCTVKNYTKCEDERTFNVSFDCSFCYQTPDWAHVCTPNTQCRRNDWNQKYKANCTVLNDVICLGSRTFYKNVQCNWTSGYKWSVAMVLSVFFGGFGADRFYLGHYKEGLGKLFSFGGVGIWTLIDIVLIYTGYVGPYDGSSYI